MSKDDAEHRADIVARLEDLQYEIHVDCLYLSPVDKSNGKQFHVQSGPISDAWSFESRRELWKLSAPLVWNGRYDESETDHGLARWLFDRAQQFVSPTGCTGYLANPIQVWTNGVRNSAEPGPDISCAQLVCGDPRLATHADLASVSSKASLLVGVFREHFEKTARLEKNYHEFRRERDLSESEQRYREMQEREMRWASWNGAHWRIYADIVHHYASALLPEDFAKCKQVARRSWLRRDEIDWPALEQEFLLLSSRLQWLKPPTKPTSSVDKPIDSIHVTPPNSDASIAISLDRAIEEIKPLLKQEFEAGRSLLTNRDLGQLLQSIPSGDASGLKDSVIECLRHANLIEHSPIQLKQVLLGKYEDTTQGHGFLTSTPTKDGYRILASIRTISKQIDAEAKGTVVIANRLRLRRSLQSARDELALARERAESYAELAVRSRRAVIQACLALHADVCLDIPSITHSPFWGLRRERPGEMTDEAAFSWWLFDVCSWVRSTSTVWPGGAGEYDFAPPLRNEAGKMIDKDGNELIPIKDADGSMRWSGEIVTQMQVESEADQKIRMQLRAKDWLDVIDRLLELVDEAPTNATEDQVEESAVQPREEIAPPLLLNDTLLGILEALDGKALRVEKLAEIVTGGETSRLYRDGMKTVLEKQGLIILDRRIGYYRPDKPPPDRVSPAAKLDAKK